jgi:O-methyltransferase
MRFAIKTIDRIIGFVDTDKSRWGTHVLNVYTVFPPSQIPNLDYDKIVIANNSSDLARQSIHYTLFEMGIEDSQIEFYPKVIICEPIEGNRVRSFKRTAQLIKDLALSGNVAECGVLYGNFAQHINYMFPDKKLYLFDSFEGYFNEQDVAVETQLGNNQYTKVGRFDYEAGIDVAIKRVMRKMIFPENVIVKQGWVPDTFSGVNDTFCFVSLDMDLYQPMFEAIKFFYPLMVSGGGGGYDVARLLCSAFTIGEKSR